MPFLTGSRERRQGVKAPAHQNRDPRVHKARGLGREVGPSPCPPCWLTCWALVFLSGCNQKAHCWGPGPSEAAGWDPSPSHVTESGPRQTTAGPFQNGRSQELRRVPLSHMPATCSASEPHPQVRRSGFRGVDSLLWDTQRAMQRSHSSSPRPSPPPRVARGLPYLSWLASCCCSAAR